MEAVLGLLVMLFGLSQGVETYCDGRQDGAQCYGALGGTAILQLMTDASVLFRYKWFKNKTTVILPVKRDKVVSNEIHDRSSFTVSNGTFRISNLSRMDSAEYLLSIYNSEGHLSEKRTLQLTIQAPVSSAKLVIECLSQGEMRVLCSSEGGDSPQYSWTLDGHTLTDAELLSGNNDSDAITLTQGLSGRLLCTVSNHVSDATKELQKYSCEERSLIFCISRTALILLVVVGAGVYFAWMKKRNKKTKGSDTLQVRRSAEHQAVSENTFSMVVL